MLEVSYGGFSMVNNPSLLSSFSITDMASVFIALVALAFTVWQGFKQRKHDQLSFQPHLDFFERKGRLEKEASFSLVLMNNGLGPAFVKSHKVYKGEKGSADFKEVDLEEELKRTFANMSWLHVVVLRDDCAIPANHQLQYLEIKIKTQDPHAVEFIRSAIYEYNIEIEYECIYKKRKVFNTFKYTQDKPVLKTMY